MTDSIIDQAARVLDEHKIGTPNGGTASLAWCTCSCGYQAKLHGGTRDLAVSLVRRHVAEALADASLLTQVHVNYCRVDDIRNPEAKERTHPEIDDAMIERGYEAFVKSNPDLGEDVGLVDIEAALRAAIGGEQ